MIILEAEGFLSVVVGNLYLETPSGLADKKNRPHLHVGSLVGHSLNRGGAQQVKKDGGEGLGFQTDSLLGQAAHSLTAQLGCFCTAD